MGVQWQQAHFWPLAQREPAQRALTLRLMCLAQPYAKVAEKRTAATLSPSRSACLWQIHSRAADTELQHLPSSTCL